jgi:hypothetical protein
MRKRRYTAVAVGIALAVGCADAESANSVAATSAPADGGEPYDSAGADASILFDAGKDGGGTQISCLSQLVCVKATISEYEGRIIPPITGGSITDGLYRAAYQLVSYGTLGSIREIKSDGRFFLFANGKYKTLETYGTFKTAGTKISFNSKVACDPHTGREELRSNNTQESDYSVDGKTGAFILLDSTSATIYLPVQTLCPPGAAGAGPRDPKDSYRCSNSQCQCAEAAGNTVNPAACAAALGK